MHKAVFVPAPHLFEYACCFNEKQRRSRFTVCILVYAYRCQKGVRLIFYKKYDSIIALFKIKYNISNLWPKIPANYDIPRFKS